MAATRPYRISAEPPGAERSAISATTSYLHIQTSGEPTARVLELKPSLASVRIGRGIQCEVRLNQVGLGDVQCLLRRRGDDWQMQPVGPPGRIWVNGRPADHQQVLPTGATLQVGRFQLTIHQSEPTEQGRGSFDAPISIGPESVESAFESKPKPTHESLAPLPSPKPTPRTEPVTEPGPSTSDDRARRWQSRLEQRDQWNKDRQNEKRWEARWKAAGETIRARSAPGTPPVETPPPVNPAPTPAPSPMTRPTVARSSHARVFEPRPVFGPPKRVGDLEPKPDPVRVPLQLRTAEAGPTPVPVEPAAKSHPIFPPLSVVEATTVALSVEPAPNEPTRPEELTVASPSQSRNQVPEAVEAHLIGSKADQEVEADLTGDPTQPEASPNMAGATAFDQIPVESFKPLGIDSPELPEPISSVAPGPIMAPANPYPGLKSETRSIPPRAESKDWPSARAIFDAQKTRATAGMDREPQASPKAPRARRAPEPTEATRPEAWMIPLWLGWIPSALGIMVLGFFSLGLAVVWVGDASDGNLAIRLATRPEGAPSQLDPQIVPKTAWWRTTASHLAAWALAFERVGSGEDRTADARVMEADARTVSPLGARSRFAAEPVPGHEADASGSIRLGPTRDVVTLTAMAHRLARENKKRDAIRAYRAAFLTASTTARSTLSRPVFRADAQINRYGLPHSTLLDDIARDMVASGDWTAEEWSEAIPNFGPAHLAVASAIRPKDPAEAERWLKAICQRADSPLDPRFEPSEHRAAVAEALAEERRYDESVEQYRRAIDGETRDLDRRVWWFNLAEVARRNNDEATRNEAIEAAKGVDLSDEVTQRAANAHKNIVESHPSARNR